MGQQQKTTQCKGKTARVTTLSKDKKIDVEHATNVMEVENGIAADNKVDKIRDILFGSQMRSYEARFNQLDERLTGEINRLREDSVERIEKLETFVKNELHRTGEKLSAEKAQRGEAITGLQSELTALAKLNNERLDALNEELAKENNELRQLLHDQVSDVLSKISRSEVQLSDQLNRQGIQLNNTKVGRADLADLFSEVSLRLNAQFDLDAAVAGE